MIRNFHTNPNCLQQIRTYNCTSVTQRTDGHWEYVGGTLSTYCHMYIDGTVEGDVITAVMWYPNGTLDTATPMHIENCTTIFIRDLGDDTYLIATRCRNNANKALHGRGTVSVPLHIGCFSSDDWPKILAMYEAGDLPTPWFYYDTMPLD